MKKTAVKFLNHTCRVYTITAVLLLLLQIAIAGNAEQTVIRPEAFLLVLPFACGFALADLLYTWKGAPHIARLLGHFIMVVLSAFLFLYLPMAGAENVTSQKLTFLVILAAAYWICMLPYLIVVSIVKRKKNATTEYQSAFKKNGK